MPPLAASRIQPLVVTLACVALAVLTVRPARSDQFKSSFVKVSDPWLSTVTTLYVQDPVPGEAPVRPRINLRIKNRSNRAFWFRAILTPPPPHSGRSGTAYLEPGQSVEFESTQDSLLADTDYQFDVYVFSNKAETDTLEASSARFRFPVRAVRDAEKRIARELRAKTTEQEAERHASEEMMEARQLPKTYDGVIVVEGKIGLGVTTFSARGTVTVGNDSLRYVSKKRTFAIAGTQLRSVQVLVEHSVSCVGVEYDDGGASKQIRFVTGLLAGQENLSRLQASLTALKEQSAKPE